MKLLYLCTLLAVLALAAVLAGCGSGDAPGDGAGDSTPAATDTPQPTEEPSPTATSLPAPTNPPTATSQQTETKTKGEGSKGEVAEYAAWCGKRAAEAREPGTWGEAVSELGRALDEYESVTAPEELQAVHSAVITLLKAQIDLYRSQDGSEPYDEFLFGQQPNALKVITPLFTAMDALDEEVVSQLENSGCLTTEGGS